MEGVACACLSVSVATLSAKATVLVGQSDIELDVHLSHHRSDLVIRECFFDSYPGSYASGGMACELNIPVLLIASCYNLL